MSHIREVLAPTKLRRRPRLFSFALGSFSKIVTHPHNELMTNLYFTDTFIVLALVIRCSLRIQTVYTFYIQNYKTMNVLGLHVVQFMKNKTKKFI